MLPIEFLPIKILRFSEIYTNIKFRYKIKVEMENLINLSSPDKLLYYAKVYQDLTRPPTSSQALNLYSEAAQSLKVQEYSPPIQDQWQKSYSTPKPIPYNSFTQAPELLVLSSGFLFILGSAPELSFIRKMLVIILYVIFISVIIEQKYIKLKNVQSITQVAPQ
ncbi:MAG: hypothetical protein ACRYGG_03135 [Janthinobacterium lividum]